MKKLLNSILILFAFILGTTLTADNLPKEPTDKWGFLSENIADVNGVKVSKQDLLAYIKNISRPYTKTAIPNEK